MTSAGFYSPDTPRPKAGSSRTEMPDDWLEFNYLQTSHADMKRGYQSEKDRRIAAGTWTNPEIKPRQFATAGAAALAAGSAVPGRTGAGYTEQYKETTQYKAATAAAAKANEQLEADRLKEQKQADLQSYAKLRDERGVFARYISGQLPPGELVKQMTPLVESRLGPYIGTNLPLFPGEKPGGARQTYESEIYRMVQQEIQKLQASPMFKDYQFPKVGIQQYERPVVPAVSTVSTEATADGGAQVAGLPKGMDPKNWQDIDAWIQAGQPQEWSPKAAATAVPGAPRLDYGGGDDDFVTSRSAEGFGVGGRGEAAAAAEIEADRKRQAAGTNIPGIGFGAGAGTIGGPGGLDPRTMKKSTAALDEAAVEMEGGAGAQDSTFMAGRKVGDRHEQDPRYRWNGSTFVFDPPAQAETKDPFDPSGAMDRYLAQLKQQQTTGATYGDTTINYYRTSGGDMDYSADDPYKGGEAPSGTDEKGYSGVPNTYARLPNGQPNPAFYGGEGVGAGDYKRGSTWGTHQMDAFMAAGGSRTDFDEYWRAQRDPLIDTEGLKKKILGQAYIGPKTSQEELEAKNLADMQAGIPSTQRAGSPYELTSNKYREGYFGDPGSRESFKKLYDEFLTQRRAVLVGVLSSGQKEKINLDDQQYATEKTRLMNEVMELAQGVRDRWKSQTAVSEAQGAKMQPPLEFDIPWDMERGVSPEGKQLVTQAKTGLVGLGFNAETIRQNLNKLPPGDDRRAALTDVLMLYEGFEARVAEAKTAADAQVQLETFRQGFESTERQLRDTLSREDRAQDQQIQREIDTWQRNQADYLQKFQLNLQEAQMSGRWEGGTQTLERTRLEHQQAMEKETLAQTGQQRGFEQEMRTGQQALQMGQLGIEQTRAEQSATIAAAEAKRDEWQIGREKRDWEGEQTRLNAVLTGYLETPANKTLAAQEFGWAKILEEADRTGLFGENKIETMAFKSQKFQEGLAKTKVENAARLEEIKLEMNENDNETKIAVADKQVAIEQGKLEDAVKSRRVQMKLEGDKLDFQKTQMRLEALQSLANPKTLLVFQRTGMIPMLERVLGMSLNMPTFPELLPPGQTIPTQQYLNMASPGDRELIMAEASLRSGFSEMDVRSVLQRQMPGGLGVAIGYRGEGR